MVLYNKYIIMWLLSPKVNNRQLLQFYILVFKYIVNVLYICIYIYVCVIVTYIDEYIFGFLLNMCVQYVIKCTHIQLFLEIWKVKTCRHILNCIFIRFMGHMENCPNSHNNMQLCFRVVVTLQAIISTDQILGAC